MGVCNRIFWPFPKLHYGTYLSLRENFTHQNILLYFRLRGSWIFYQSMVCGLTWMKSVTSVMGSIVPVHDRCHSVSDTDRGVLVSGLIPRLRPTLSITKATRSLSTWRHSTWQQFIMEEYWSTMLTTCLVSGQDKFASSIKTVSR